MGALQPAHLILILAIVLVIFGPRKLGDLGKALGEGVRELKKAADPHPDADHSGSASATVTAARTCPSCHGAIAPSDKFCGHCGANLSSAA